MKALIFIATALLIISGQHQLSAQTASLGGSVLTNNNEGAIRSGGDSLLITLSGETWALNIGLDNDTTQNLINSVTGNGDWTKVTALLDYSRVFRRSDEVVSIILPAVIDYNIFLDETISVNLDETTLTTSLSSLAAGTFLIEHDPVTAVLSGTVDGATESEIRAGGETIIITLFNDIWAVGAAFDNTVRTAIINGISGDQNWADLTPFILPSNVVRTSDNAVTITIPANTAYYIGNDENISVTVPASALEYQDYNVIAGPGLQILNEGVSFTVSGTASGFPGAAESEIRSNSETIILTLSGDKWLTTIDNNFAVASQLLSNITGSSSWNSEVMSGLDESNITLVNDYTVRITLEPAPSYQITATDNIRIEVVAAVLRTTSSGSLVRDPALSISPSPVTVILGGNIFSGSYNKEDSIRAGGATITLSLSEDSWEPGTGGANAITEAVINGITGGSSWNSEVIPALLGGNMGAGAVDVTGNVLTISFPPVPAYNILGNDVISISVPGSALVQTAGNINPGSTLTIIPAPRVASLTSAPLVEYSMDGAVVSLTLKDETFTDTNLQPSNFVSNYPALVGISSVNWISSTQAGIVLDHLGDFDSDISDFRVNISGSELASGSGLLSGPISISASLEPHISNVTIQADTFKIGDVVRVDLIVDNDLGEDFQLASGSVAGKNLTGLTRISPTLYYAYFTVTSGDADYIAGTPPIPVNNLRLDNPPLVGEVYNGTIINQTIIDAHIPVIHYLSSSGNIKKVGDQVDIIVSADGNTYVPVSPTMVNGVNYGESNISWSNLGNGVYLLSYLVEEGDNNVSTGNLTASLRLRDVAGNICNTFNTLNANTISIDANSPVVNAIRVEDRVYTAGNVIDILIETDGNNYTFLPETSVNGVPISSPYLNGSLYSGNNYRLQYTVRSGDAEVEPGDLELTVRMKDPAGNNSMIYSDIETNSLAIYTILPQATLLGNQEICEDGTANLIANLTGRFPMTIYLNDGSSRIKYEGILSSPYNIQVNPTSTTNYRIDTVYDYNGIKNTGTGTAQVIVNAKTDVEILNLNSNYSLEDPPFVLQANISGGTFYGPGVVSATSVFNPASADTTNSPHTIYYSYQNSKGCISKDSSIVFILSAKGDITIPKDVFCDYAADFTVIASNTAGTTGKFRLLNKGNEPVAGLTDNRDNTAVIRPASLEEGNYSIEYEYDDGGANLILRKSFSIETVKQPRIISPSENEFCQNSNIVNLEGDISSAVFSGSPGITGDIVNGFKFNPALANIGVNRIYYTSTTVNNCSGSSSRDLTVFYVPPISFLEADVCIVGDNRDTTLFSNLTPDKHVYEKWTWEFGETNSPLNFSNSVQGEHSYNDPGNRTVKLTGVTLDNCSSQFSKTIQFGNKPFGGFKWNNECFIEGDSILFTNNSLAEDPIVEYKWTFFDSQSDSVIRNGAQVYHVFPGISTYPVKLYVRTSIGCENSFRESIALKNTYRMEDEGDYFIDFEEGMGRWSAGRLPESEYNSWVYGMTGFNGLLPENNSTAWSVIPPDSSNIIEQSYILSPCFDLRAFEKPMVSVDIYRNMLANEGVVLQYSTDNQNTWKNLGFYNEGINWFNSFSIAGAPGDQEIGWSGVQSSSGWMKAMRYASEELENKPNVQFRFIYGAEHSKGLDREGFSFDNFRIGSRTRMVLVEHFTNGNDTRVKNADAHINLLYNQNFGDIVKLEYHTDIPSADLFYSQNKYVPGTRILYYGVDAVPYTLIDGGKDGLLKFDNPASILQLDENDIILESLYEPAFQIDLAPSYFADHLEADITITAKENMEADERLVQVVVFEKKVTASPLPNGQSVFLNLVRDMVPNAAGTAFFHAWTKGQTETLSLNWDHVNVVDPSMLRVAVFIQNDRSRYIYQATTDDITNMNTGIKDRAGIDFNMIIFPNPAMDFIRFSAGNAPANDMRLEIFDQTGRLWISQSWTRDEIQKEVNTALLPGGIYLVRITNLKDFNSVTRKVSVIH